MVCITGDMRACLPGSISYICVAFSYTLSPNANPPGITMTSQTGEGVSLYQMNSALCPNFLKNVSASKSQLEQGNLTIPTERVLLFFIINRITFSMLLQPFYFLFF